MLKGLISNSGDRIAIATPSENVTYDELIEKINRFRITLNKTISFENKRVVILVPHTISLLSLIIAAEELGATVVPLSMQLREHDLFDLLDMIDPSIVITVHTYNGFDYKSSILEWTGGTGIRKEVLILASSYSSVTHYCSPGLYEEEIKTDRHGLLLCSTGSTSVPKLISYNEQQFYQSMKYMKLICRYPLDDAPFGILASPISLPGIVYTFAVLHDGGTAVLFDTFQLLECIELYERWHPVELISTPSIIKLFFTLEQKVIWKPSRNFRSVLLTGERINHEMISTLFDRCPNSVFGGLYGLTEIGATMICPDLRKDMKYYPLPGITVRIDPLDDNNMESNELGIAYLKSPAMMKGYYQAGQVVDIFDNGWFSTGDILEKSGAGYYIKGRQKDMIKKFGQSLIPSEIEEFLCSHPSIENVAVLGVPDPICGEQIAAVVKAHNDISLEDIHDYCKNKIADIKIPERILIIEDLPSRNGKLDKRLLRELLIASSAKASKVAWNEKVK